ncbi:C-1-tetrahydrofolate synthase, cytoplasmic [Hypsibius exemplaris]|uniref:C-1-tetrahydrofolate synthase, cytoplasmic n=1 Tax=Hypsibius exemplaris TaxID=2072580 RepID=A0A1W0X0L0_HYPEX|nr:C-1-tetrahydrofolate synthase, cytoplasmic [Hypsibius exemplaris]
MRCFDRNRLLKCWFFLRVPPLQQQQQRQLLQAVGAASCRRASFIRSICTASATGRRQKSLSFPFKSRPLSIPLQRRLSGHIAREKMENVQVSGQLLDGKIVAGEIQNEIARKAALLKDATGVVPCLAIVQVGDKSDSNVYIRMKVKAAGDVGIAARHVKLPADITEDQLLDEVESLNRDSTVHGIIVQLPLECTQKIDASKVTDTILPTKDVDGLHTINAGHVARGEFDKCTLPCTPNGCLELIKRSGHKVAGSRAVVIGRSKIVGGPMAEMLMWNNATVTICHSRTANLPQVVGEADILVVAIGRANFVEPEWIKPGAVVIDCGINVVPDDKLKSGRRIVGDVDFAGARKVASWITPVPGGVGPMTVAMLLRNTLDCATKFAKFL